MFGRTSLLALGFAAAIGLPYLTSSSGLRKLASQESGEKSEVGTSGHAGIGGEASASADGQAGQAPKMEHPEGPPVQQLSEVFRFDMTNAWVLGRWPRVSTRLATLDLQGYRVPLVTGTKESDLAGALTYYFNPNQRIQRITFIGKTGDARPLVALLATQYGFVRQTINDPSLHLYQVKSGREVKSEMRIRSVGTVTSTDPYGRFEVALVIERPAKME